MTIYVREYELVKKTEHGYVIKVQCPICKETFEVEVSNLPEQADDVIALGNCPHCGTYLELL